MKIFIPIKRFGLLLLVITGLVLSAVGVNPRTVRAQGETQSAPLISDSLFLLSSTVLNYDVQAFLDQQTGPLSTYSEIINGEEWSASRSISYNAFYYGINPQVILVLLESYNNVITDPNAQVPKALIGNATDSNPSSLFYFVKNLASYAEETFSRRLNETGQGEIRLDDGTVKQVADNVNAGTFALLACLAKTQSAQNWNSWISSSSPIFVEIFTKWFNDPLYDPDKNNLSVDAIPSGYSLPFPAGHTWYYTGGPHNYAGSNTTARPWSSIDLAQPEILYCPESTYAANEWIVASKGGTVVLSQTALVVIDHGDGWRTYYSHVSTADRIALGGVNKGDYLGHPSCEKEPGGIIEGVHVHFAIYLVGTGFVNISGSSLSDWVVGETSYYNGTLSKPGVTRTAIIGRINGTNDILNSESGGGELAAPSLKKPANGAVLNRTDPVNLSWNTASGATQYYAEFWGGPSLSLNSGYTSGTSWAISSQRGGSYQWHVKARNSSGESAWSETRTLTIKYGSPSNLSASAVSQSQVNLSWSPSADGPGNIDGYRIYRNGSAISTVGKSTTTFSDTGRRCSTSYSYTVKAYKGSIQSDASNTASATTQACPMLHDFNFLVNPEFEMGGIKPDMWKTDALVSSYSTFKWVSNQAHSGTKSIKIVNTQANDAQWMQTVAVQPNTDYQLSGWIKTKDVAHSTKSVDAGANLSIMGGAEHTDGLFGTNDWTFVSMTFNSGSRTTIQVAARIGYDSGITTGTAWFDDLSLAILGEPVCYTLQTIVNPLDSGKINVLPPPNCNDTQYMHGTVVKLRTSPSTGYSFKTWKGDIISSMNPINLVMTGNKVVTAKFVIK